LLNHGLTYFAITSFLPVQPEKYFYVTLIASYGWLRVLYRLGYALAGA
jgi:hypothetical protein